MFGRVGKALAIQLSRLSEVLAADADGATREVELTPLTSEYKSDEHEEYVRHIETAINNPRLRNIALAGRYGSGKSSVLDEVQSRHKKTTLRIALSDLGKAEDGETLINRVEKEFVKQLLHREPARRFPRSRYPRIATRPRSLSLVLSALQLATVALLLWTLGVQVPLRSLGVDKPLWVRSIPLVALVTTVLLALTWLKSWLGNRVVSQLGAAGASVTIKKEEETYFDKYLDEIVYFFVQTKVRIVILEDLDRFNNAEIFQAMRELNGVLNNSLQIKRPIHFIYAIRDSIFDDSERARRDRALDLPHELQHTEWLDSGADSEAALANRTKFFELVIPMVPFVTHGNARDLLGPLLKSGRHQVSEDLIDLVARRLPDMRLLQNISNEYSVFAKNLITDARGVKDLPPDKLFAMVVYKNAYLRDFENMLLGQGKLDQLDRQRRRLVQSSIKSIEESIESVRNGLTQAELVRANLSGLRRRIERMASAVLQGSSGQYAHAGYQIDGVRWSTEDAEKYEFWKALSITRGTWYIVLSQYLNNTFLVHLGKEDVDLLLGNLVDMDAWGLRDEAADDAAIDDLEEEIETIRHADFRALMQLPDYRVDFEGQQRSFTEIVDQLFPRRLAVDLIAGGYIDSFYAFYVARYYGGRVSAPAMKFLMINVADNIPEFEFPLSRDEVHAVVRETDGQVVHEVSGYNISLLDALLDPDSEDPKLRRLGEQLLRSLYERFGELEEEFLSTYLRRGEYQSAATAFLAYRWGGIFDFLVEEPAFDDQARSSLVDTALQSISRAVDYVGNTRTRDFIQLSIEDLSATTATHPADTVDKIAELLFRFEVICERLEVLSSQMRLRFVEGRRFAVTGENLRLAAGCEDLALDNIQVASDAIYDFCLHRASEYLKAWESDASTEYTVEDPGAFVPILRDIARLQEEVNQWTESDCKLFIDHASPECVVADLRAEDTAPVLFWVNLAEQGRILKTIENIDAYIDELQGINAALATMLLTDMPFRGPRRVGTEAERREDPSVQLTRVALQILKAKDVIPDPVDRTGLVERIGLTEKLDPSNVAPEPGRLLGLLISKNICADSLTLFERFAGMGWESLRSGILASSEFLVFMTPAVLPEDMVDELMREHSPHYKLRQVSERVLEELGIYVASMNPRILGAVARFAARSGPEDAALPIATIAMIAGNAERAARPSILALVARAAKHLSARELIDTLVSLDPAFAGLLSADASLEFPESPALRSIFMKLKRDKRLSSVRSKKNGMIGVQTSQA